MFTRNVSQALVKQGKMTETDANTLVRRYAGTVMMGHFVGDAAEDVAHDLYLMRDLGTSSSSDPTMEAMENAMLTNLPAALPRLRKPTRRMA